ncbi:MAG: YegS/Rv2252/BmrU family lipid kinase [Bacteroidota bacterium]|nr:YegS/Rv2252/BmrU family lipid kinase [Bacteroidota bacterium]MDP3144018.1 YegS/Rv2252/BmrU family lipid kinase [Bacteroidota bacterium]
MPRKLLFIVNPNAGKKISGQLIDTIKKEFPPNIYYQIVIWKDKDHFKEVLDILHSQDYTDAIAVGGDGTVNAVAKSIIGTSIALGIVPAGSGNGLARTLGISMEVEEAIKQIAQGNKTIIDHGVVNGIPFFCTSGIGFDAHIGNLFATSAKRGLQSYVKITIAELFKYRAKQYTLKFNDQIIQRKAFLITIANAGQYGNDFYIAPQASMQDGLFHVVVLKPFNVLHLPGLLIKMLNKKAHLSSRIETYTTNKITIIREGKDTIHFDGEPAIEEKEVVFENKPNSLNVIIGDKFKVA